MEVNSLKFTKSQKGEHQHDKLFEERFERPHGLGDVVFDCPFRHSEKRGDLPDIIAFEPVEHEYLARFFGELSNCVLHGLLQFVEKKRILGFAEWVHGVQPGKGPVLEMIDNAVADGGEEVALQFFDLQGVTFFPKRYKELLDNFLGNVGVTRFGMSEIVKLFPVPPVNVLKCLRIVTSEAF